MLENDPAKMRQVYFTAWQKALKSEALTDMEAIIVDIIKRHPEYHPIFNHPEGFKELKDEKFEINHNPFFHLALHVTIAEQVRADRPHGIKAIYFELLKKYDGDMNNTEHRMIECLAKFLVESFHRESEGSEELYLEALRKLI